MFQTSNITEIFYIDPDGTQKGPIDERHFQALVRCGDISSQTYCWKEGMVDWQPANAVFARESIPSLRSGDARQSSEWYYLKDSRPYGPFSEQEMRESFRRGQLAWNTYVWKRELKQWQPADEVGFRWPGVLPIAKFLIVRTFFLLIAVGIILGAISWFSK